MNLFFHPSRWRWFCLIIAAGFYLAGLWPFNFRARNRAAWQPDPGGIHFAPHGIVYGETNVNWNPPGTSPFEPATFTLEIWLRADEEANGGVPHILSLYDGRLPENLVLGQWRSSILLRSALFENPSGRGYREMGARSALETGQWRFITLTCDAEGSAFYLDGQLAERRKDLVLSPRQWQGQWILGNAARGGRDWQGVIGGWALFHGSLSSAEIQAHHAFWTNGTARVLASAPQLAALYVFDHEAGRRLEDLSPARHALVMPELYQVPHPNILVPPGEGFRLDGVNRRDILVNLLGFLPFGWCYYRCRRVVRRDRPLQTISRVLLVSAALSLSIELAQILLPSRSSSATDVICNVLGAGLGLSLTPLLDALERRLPFKRKSLIEAVDDRLQVDQ